MCVSCTFKGAKFEQGPLRFIISNSFSLYKDMHHLVQKHSSCAVVTEQDFSFPQRWWIKEVCINYYWQMYKASIKIKRNIGCTHYCCHLQINHLQYTWKYLLQIIDFNTEACIQNFTLYPSGFSEEIWVSLRIEVTLRFLLWYKFFNSSAKWIFLFQCLFNTLKFSCLHDLNLTC